MTLSVENDNSYYNPDHGQLCRVVETRTLSGDTFGRVWLPGEDAVGRLRATPRQELVTKLHPRADMRLGKPSAPDPAPVACRPSPSRR
ncbi:MAG: hypothetical protein KatS3mg119_2349 [Rhodothalassiaceae bacterium]|nr:MAG: hypothetical protein KatS3mg119_2349 [Rhodothalassiaceae bacterium]